MKKVCFLLLIAVGFSAGSAIGQQTDNGAKIEFEKEVHDYGIIEYGANGEYKFKFTNTGKSPLILADVKGSCSCTVPFWPKEPIAPGASAVITVKYNTKRAGAINKSVTVTSNAVNAPVKVIRIKGNVKAQPSSGAPLNETGPVTH